MSVRARVDGFVASIVVDRPARRNAFTQDMWKETTALIRRLDADPDIRVMALESAVEGVFSAGADLDELRAASGDADRAAADLEVIRGTFEAMVEVTTPIVAFVDGACHGGGVGMAVCADIRIATDRSRFSIPPARLGLVYPAPALRRLVGLVGPGQARRLLFTASTIDASEAERIGLIEVTCAHEELADRRAEIVEEIAGASPTAVAAMGSLIDRIHDDRADELARTLERRAVVGPDHREGLSAVLEGRPPSF